MALTKTVMLVAVALAVLAVVPALARKRPAAMNKVDRTAYQNLFKGCKQLENALEDYLCDVPEWTAQPTSSDSYAVHMAAMAAREAELEAALAACIASGSTTPAGATDSE